MIGYIFRLVGRVSRGFRGRVIDGASLPGAALLSFPKRSDRERSATRSGEVGASGTDGVAAMASDCIGLSGVRRLGPEAENVVESVTDLLPGSYRLKIVVGKAQIDGSGSTAPRGQHGGNGSKLVDHQAFCNR